MTVGVTPPVLNPESVSQHDVSPCYAADTRQRTKEHDVFFELLAEVNSETYRRANSTVP
jgi:hypothetical protein